MLYIHNIANTVPINQDLILYLIKDIYVSNNRTNDSQKTIQLCTK